MTMENDVTGKTVSPRCVQGSARVSSAPPLSGELNIRVAHTIMPGERIRPAECLFVRAQVAADFLLARIVNGVFMTGKVVRS